MGRMDVDDNGREVNNRAILENWNQNLPERYSNFYRLYIKSQAVESHTGIEMVGTKL